jgi:hypothetical protein
MAIPAPYLRTIDERAYLSEMNLMFAINMAHVLTHELLIPQMNPKNLDELIQEAAQLVLTNPYFAKRAELLGSVTSNAKIHYPNLEIDRLSIDEAIPLKHRIEDWTKSMVTCAGSALLKASGWEVFPLSDREIPCFIHLPVPLEKISCYEYALMRAGVEEAFIEKLRPEEILGKLQKWDFVTIPKEETRPGDLVVFMKHGKMVHMGIRYKDRILSKPGNDQEFAYLHKAEEAFPSYGNQVLYFRRKILV